MSQRQRVSQKAGIFLVECVSMSACVTVSRNILRVIACVVSTCGDVLLRVIACVGQRVSLQDVAEMSRRVGCHREPENGDLYAVFAFSRNVLQDCVKNVATAQLLLAWGGAWELH